jgi:hypothetical protein
MEDETVPKGEHLKRLAAKQAKIEELTQANSTLAGQLKEAEQVAKQFDPSRYEKRIARLTQERDTVRDEFDQFKAQSLTREAMLGNGITDADDQELLRWRYNRIPEADRPELGAWLKEGAREDKQVRHLFGAEESEPAKRPGLPSVNNGARSPAKPPNSLSLDAFMAKPLAERVSPEGRAEFARLIGEG